MSALGQKRTSELSRGIFQLSACVYRPFPRPIRQNIVVVEFLGLAVRQRLQQREDDDGDDDTEDSQRERHCLAFHSFDGRSTNTCISARAGHHCERSLSFHCRANIIRLVRCIRAKQLTKPDAVMNPSHFIQILTVSWAKGDEP